MKNRTRFWLAGLVLVLLVPLVVWWLRPSRLPPSLTDTASTGPQTPVETATPSAFPNSSAVGTQVYQLPGRNKEREILTVFSKPFVFWGKAVDEHGAPVEGAIVDWSANNNPDPHSSGTKGRTTTDPTGMFSIACTGVSLSIDVSKEGYYRVPTSLDNRQIGSTGGFSNAEKLGNTDMPMGKQSSPTIFKLRKKGELASLIHVTERPVKVPKDGTPVEISLTTGEVVPAGGGGLEMRCWTEDQTTDAQGHYSWVCRASVPGGGLQERDNEYDFEAPPEGYRPVDNIKPPEERWAPVAERGYFIRTSDGHFARVNLRMRTAGEHFVVIESYFNPQLDSRNLEYDQAQQVSVP